MPPKQERFLPRNPHKYAGNLANIVARSSWELRLMNSLDMSNLVLKWVSEPKYLNIRYMSPIDKKLHSYWPDFIVQYIDGTVDIIEVKPMKESSLSSAKSTYDKLMLAKNIMKWRAAEAFAKKAGAKFKVLTEKQLLGKRTKR